MDKSLQDFFHWLMTCGRDLLSIKPDEVDGSAISKPADWNVSTQRPKFGLSTF